MSERPLTEMDLAQWEADTTPMVLPRIRMLALIAEVRRLQKQYADNWKAGAAADLRTERIEAELLAMTVERDNLRKMLADANEREELQLEAAHVAMAMATKRGGALETLRMLTEDIGNGCWTCKSLRDVIDPALFVDGQAEVERLKKLERVKVSAALLFTLRQPCENDLKGLREALDALNDSKPVPMCQDVPLGRCFERWANPLVISKPDPLEDIFPAGGSPT